MKNRRPNAALVWKQYEDLLAPRLHFSRTDRAVYSHLFRHSRLEGKAKFRFSISWLARGVGLSMKATRGSVRSLVARGVLDLIERNCRTQHVIRLRLPLEVKGVHAGQTEPPESTKAAVNIEEEDFVLKQILRRSLHDREGGNCFYCMRRTGEKNWCLDHVVPQARGGGNSYRNLVSCCVECNSSKGERPAEEYLRELYRERRLDARELGGRLRALDDLAGGKLKPVLPGQAYVADLSGAGHRRDTNTIQTRIKPEKKSKAPGAKSTPREPGRVYQTVRVTPAMEAGIADHV